MVEATYGAQSCGATNLLYTDFSRLVIDLLITARNRTRFVRQAKSIDEAAELTALFERLRFFVIQGRDPSTGPTNDVIERIEEAFYQILRNDLFIRHLAERPASRASPMPRGRITLDDYLPYDASYGEAFRFLAAEISNFPKQEALEFSGEGTARRQRLRFLVPEQKIAPAQFEFVDQMLVVVEQKTAVRPADQGNVSAARRALIEQGQRILANLAEVNFDRKLKESFEALQDALVDGKDIIKLGIMTMTCEHVICGVEEQISTVTAELLRAHTNGLRLYVSQFPDWRRFAGNADQVTVSDADIGKLLDAAQNLVAKLSANDHVDPEVPKVIAFVAQLVKNPRSTSKRAVFSLLRTIENLISKVYGYFSNFIGEVASKTSSKVSGAVAVGLATAILVSTVNLGSVFKSIPEASWVPDASKIVEQYIMHAGNP